MMDEPTVGLDRGTFAKLLELMTRLVEVERKAFLVIEHNMDAVMSVSAKVVLLVQGAVVASARQRKSGAIATWSMPIWDAGMLLQVTDLQAGYGKKQVIHGMSLEVREREIVAVLGHNGAGKSTLMNAIFGVIRRPGAACCSRGKDITGQQPSTNVQAGLGYSPQGARCSGP